MSLPTRRPDTRKLSICGCGQYKSSLKHDGGLAACGMLSVGAYQTSFLMRHNARANIVFTLTTSIQSYAGFSVCIVLLLVATRFEASDRIAVGLLGCLLQGLVIPLTLLRVRKGSVQ
jgi:hypothetical protein